MTGLIRAAAALLAIVCATTSAVAAPPDRPVHRFLSLAVSPDGKNIASVEGDSPLSGSFPTIQELVIRSADGATANNVVLPCGHVAECWPSSPAWTPDGKHLTFALRTPGGHARSIYSVDADGGHPTRLLEFDGTIIGLRYGHDGQLSMLATAGATKEVGATQAGAPITGDLSGPPLEQRIATLKDGHLEFLSPPDLFVYEYDLLPDGSGYVGTAALGDGDNNWWIAKLYSFASGQARPIFAPPDARHQIANPRVSHDGRTVAFISGIMSDFGSTGGDIYTVPAIGGAATDITPAFHASATGIEWGCDGALLASILAGDKSEIATIASDGAAHTVGTLWSSAGSTEHVGDLNLGCPSSVTAVVRQSFTAPPEIAVGAIGGWHDLTKINAGITMPIEAKSLSWKSDGADVQGWLLLPNGKTTGKLPMITVVHGGPAAATTPAFVGPGMIHSLIDHGYAIFLPNPRGSFGQSEAFTAANVRDMGYGDFRDILAGIDAAEKAAPIDEARLGLTGGSYGGYMTMWGVTQTNRFKAAVAVAGISDMLSYYGENGIDQWMIPYFGKSVYEDPGIYARSSPITFIRNVKTPTFAYVGADDIECPAPQTQEFWHALHDLGVPTSMAIYPNEGHGLRDPAHLADSIKRTLAWFNMYLKRPVENSTGGL